MEEIKINKELESIVEAIFLHASALGEYKIKYKEAVFAVLKQYQLDNDYRTDFIPDDVENLKLRMYALVVKATKENKELAEKKKLEAIKKYKK